MRNALSSGTQPWLANLEWAQKRVTGTPASNLKTSAGAWLVGTLALGFGAAELALRGVDTWNQRSALLVILLVFPFFGVAILYSQFRVAYRKRRYAGTYFEMDSLPFFLGEKLSGRIHASSSTNAQGDAQLTLNCIRRMKSWDRGVTGRAQVTWDNLIWRQEKTSSLASSVAEAGSGEQSIVIPVEFSLPADAPSTDSTNPNDLIIWSLKVSGKGFGRDFVQYFELPVFTESGVSIRPQYHDCDFYTPTNVSLDSAQPLENGQVAITVSPAGGTEFLFLAKRHWGVATFATAALCVWTAAIRFLFWGSEPLALALFVAADFLLLYWALWCWLSKSSAVFEQGNVVLRNSLLGMGRSRAIPYGDIKDITAPIAGESGQGTEAIPHYAVFLKTSQGDVEIGGSLNDAGEAGYVVKRMKAELGRVSS